MSYGQVITEFLVYFESLNLINATLVKLDEKQGIELHSQDPIVCTADQDLAITSDSKIKMKAKEAIYLLCGSSSVILDGVTDIQGSQVTIEGQLKQPVILAELAEEQKEKGNQKKPNLWEKILDGVQLALDAVSMIPAIVGKVANQVNNKITAARGKNSSPALTLAACVPFTSLSPTRSLPLSVIGKVFTAARKIKNNLTTEEALQKLKKDMRITVMASSLEPPRKENMKASSMVINRLPLIRQSGIKPKLPVKKKTYDYTIVVSTGIIPKYDYASELRVALEKKFGGPDRVKIIAAYPFEFKDEKNFKNIKNDIWDLMTKDYPRQKIRDALVEDIKKGNYSPGKVILVGHSGGGLASFDAVQLLAMDGIAVHKIIQIGSPSTQYPKGDIPNILRISNKGDPVAALYAPAFDKYQIKYMYPHFKQVPRHPDSNDGHMAYFEDDKFFYEGRKTSTIEEVVKLIYEFAK